MKLSLDELEILDTGLIAYSHAIYPLKWNSKITTQTREELLSLEHEIRKIRLRVLYSKKRIRNKLEKKQTQVKQ